MRNVVGVMLLLLLLAASCSKSVEKNESGLCGNGTVDFEERCDWAIPEGEPGACPLSCSALSDGCSAFALVGDRLECNSYCAPTEPACGEEDSCCPAGCGPDDDADCAIRCGNGVVEEGETCDGDCPVDCDDGDLCTKDELVGSAEQCDARCVITAAILCLDADACCPAGCDAGTDSDCSNVCGDGVVDGNELCDGNCPNVCDDGDVCTIDFVVGDAATCSTECRVTPITACRSADGCCPGGCNSQNDSDCTCDPDTEECCPEPCVGAQVCEPTSQQCLCPGGDCCDGVNCPANEACNENTGICQVANCPGEDPTQCIGNAQRPIWDPIKCFCAECTGDADCPNAAAGETCNAAGSCFLCQTACDPGTPGTCQGTTPYCISDCCVECVGAADCAQGELCLDGFCGQPPNCQVDPTVCPSGYTCDPATGRCDSPNTSGMACDPMDPTSCPGSFCDPATSTCAPVGGGTGCGSCNPDCTCNGGMTCQDFQCYGCDPVACSIGQCACVDPMLGCLPLGANGEGICL